MAPSVLLWVLGNLAILVARCHGGTPEYFVGTGIHDMTGPAAQINMMGYAKTSQDAHGIHMRLRSRAFIISERAALEEEKEEEEVANLDPERTICFVSIDAGMGSDLVNTRVLQRLDELLPLQSGTQQRLCHLENLSISGTHTHSAPGGFLQYALYQITSKGFSKEVFSAYVEGIAQSILRAYNNLERGSITMGKDRLLGANINRSPTSYLLNPLDERIMYQEDGDTDKAMVQLLFTSLQREHKGVLNWFAVHGTSMNSSNLLISGDNKGYASYLMERRMNGNETRTGEGSFVAAFASTNLGDVSPNTAGPRCLDTGLPCDILTSTCNGKNALCVASGPGRTMKESTEIIGRKQFEAALSLLNVQTKELIGGVSYRHSFIDMSNKTVHLGDGKIGRTCTAALGYSFAAGTTDGPGEFDFTQGENTSNPFWNLVSHFLSSPTPEQKDCHSPKPILLNTGDVEMPYAWDPKVAPISVMRVGHVFVLNVAAELTTMAGRRLRRSITDLLRGHGVNDTEVVIAGLANGYTHYVTTIEEYQGQRYEAASTLYGPHTLRAYIQEFERITTDLILNRPSESNGPPADLGDKQVSLIPPPGIDTIAFGKKFGSVIIDADDQYEKGSVVSVTFHSANPRNNQRLEDTFLTVDRKTKGDSWETVFIDGDWSTTFSWDTHCGIIGASLARIEWVIPVQIHAGTYRICHFGKRKTIFLGNEWVMAILQQLRKVPTWLPLAGGLLPEVYSVLEPILRRVVALVPESMLFGTRDFSGCTKDFQVVAAGPHY